MPCRQMPGAPAARAGFRLTAVIVASAMFMEQLDGTVLATALPAMSRSFGVDPLHMSVALTAYLLSLAVFIPASGQIADRLGARPVFSAAILLFTASSVLCGQAQSVPMLAASRALQGLGGAMMMPVGRLVLLRSVAKRDLVNAMSWLLIPALIGPIIGPPLGGFFVTYLSWRWIFYINVPIGVLGVGLVQRYIENTREDARTPFDVMGFLLSGICLASLMTAFELASHPVLPTAALVAIAVLGLVAGGFYVRHAHRHPTPILDLTLLRVPSFGLSVAAGALTRVSAGAMPFLLPMMLQLGFGLSAVQSGFITFTGAAGSMLMKGAARPVLRRFGFRRTLIGNGVLATLCVMLYAAFRPDWPRPAIYLALLVGGFLQSLQFTAYNTVAYADITRPQMSAATSFYTTFQQLMLSAGICTAGLALSLTRLLRGHPVPLLPDFSAAFVVVGLVSLLAVPVCARLPADAGDEIAGRGTPGERRAAQTGNESDAAAMDEPVSASRR